jgi:hypothetical protein
MWKKYTACLYIERGYQGIECTVNINDAGLPVKSMELRCKGVVIGCKFWGYALRILPTNYGRREVERRRSGLRVVKRERIESAMLGIAARW